MSATAQYPTGPDAPKPLVAGTRYPRPLPNTPTWKRHGWEPRWHGGHRMDDPRTELRLIAEEAQQRRDEFVAVPVTLLLTVVDVRECSERRTFLYDEDGPISWEPEPSICRKPEGHEGDHSNGYYHWKSEPGDG